MTQEQVVHYESKEKTQYAVHGATVTDCTLRHTLRRFIFKTKKQD